MNMNKKYDKDELHEKILRKRCLYLELLWSAFSRIWTKYGEIKSMSDQL